MGAGIMERRIIAALIVVVSLIIAPQLSVFAQPSDVSSHWTITVTMCQNGFKVKAVGVATPGNATEVRLDKVVKLLPYNKPPFIQQTQPLTVTSPTGTMFIANSSNPKFGVIGTESFYFAEAQGTNSQIETVVLEFVNGG